MIKKIITIIVAICSMCLCVSGIASCDSNNGKKGKISIVTTIFSEYDWVLNVIGDQKDQMDVSILMDNGTDLHSYQPTVADIAKVSSCDLFVYVGGESDKWVKDAMKNVLNKDMVVINLMEVLGDKAKEEELVEGMEGEEGEEEEEEEEGPEYDEHVWLSLKNAKLFVTEIAKAMAKIDSEHASIYTQNALEYNAKLSDLDSKYESYIETASKKTVLFGDRFPFRYLVDDYGISYYAAFVGCSAETEASFQTIIFLANKVDELGLGTILKIESSDGKIANTIKNNTRDKNQQILVLDSLQSATRKEYEAGRNYLNVMTSNLEVLKVALS